MYYITPYYNVTNEYDHVIDCITNNKECDMIIVNNELLLNDEIKTLNDFIPHVLSNLIIEYIRPHSSFTLKFTNYNHVYVTYNGMILSSIKCNILNNTKLVILDRNIHYTRDVCTNILHKLIVTGTISWLRNLEN